MDVDVVISLFKLFSGDESPQKYYPLIPAAIQEVEKILRPDADKSDMRLYFLCAAWANYFMQKIILSHSGEYTVAGKGASNSDTPALKYAKELLKDYYDMCRELIYPQSFTFISV